MGAETCSFIIKKGDLYACGRNNVGQLGDGTTVDKNVFTKIGDMKWKMVSSGDDHTLAISEDGYLYACGGNAYGQLGDNSTVSSSFFIKIGDLKWKYITAGINASLAITEDGYLYAWGRNDLGQLGDNTKVNKGVPTKIGSLKWKMVSMSFASLAITEDGYLYAWGHNIYGQTGDGTTVTKTVPTKIGSLKWKIISCGNLFSTGITEAGDLYTWGHNIYGQLGDGTTTNKTTPTKIGSLKWKIVSTGGTYLLAVTEDGDLYGCGSNDYGQLGDGTTTNKTTPTKIGSMKWETIHCGNASSIGITTNKEIYTSGFNGYGQLGDGTTDNSSIHILVMYIILNKTLILSNGEYKKWNQGTLGIQDTVLATPKMTSDITPSGRAFASTSYSDNYRPYYVFNQIDDDEGYTTASKNKIGFLGYEFPEPKIIRKYALRSMSAAGYFNKLPKNWTFEGSNNSTNDINGDWIILDTQINQSWSSVNTDKEFEILSNNQPFKKYRLNWSENNGDVSYTSLNELKMYEVNILPAIPPSWSTISSTLPTQNQFIDKGMDSLSPLLDRKVTTLEPQSMTQDVTWAEGGKVFKKSINLKKYFDIRSINITN